MDRNEIALRDPSPISGWSIWVQPARVPARMERNINDQEIREAGAQAETIEDYPDDKYGPSGLLLGFTSAGRALHFQVTFTESDLTKIVTIYEPDPDEWIDYRRRK
jgi:hypothetical protein